MGGKISGNCREYYLYGLFSELIAYFTCILMVLSLFIVFLLLLLLCCKFVIVKNYALFGVKFVCLKFGWCKENYIFPGKLPSRDLVVAMRSHAQQAAVGFFTSGDAYGHSLSLGHGMVVMHI